MEEFENIESGESQQVPASAEPAASEVPAEPAPAQEEPSVYRSAGSGRKESPFADSPYVMDMPPQPPKPPKPKNPRKERKPVSRTLIAVLLAIGLATGSSAITAYLVNETWEERSEETFSKMRKEIEQMQDKVDAAAKAAAAALPSNGSDMTPAQLYAKNVDSVVAIATTVQTASYYGPTEATSAGSGFIFTEDGYIITNHHVVEGATEITVTTNAGEEYAAVLVGQDATNDLAVLKVEATGLQAAELGSSTDLIIGDMVVAIGNPLGELAATQTVGYVSGINREVSTGSLTTISMIQTDAAINPGNSGGPLFNMYGQVIGITTAKYSGTTGSGASIEGIGFAIPIDDVIPLIDDLIDYGYVTGGYMGITVQEVDAESAAQFGLPTGAYVASVEDGGAADRAGIQAKDIIIALDDTTVANVTDLTRALRGYKAGDTAEVTVLRSGKEVQLTITLDEKPQEQATTAETTPQQSATPQIPEEFEDFFDFFDRFMG